jgi:hypothetical protein
MDTLKLIKDIEESAFSDSTKEKVIAIYNDPDVHPEQAELEVSVLLNDEVENDLEEMGYKDQSTEEDKDLLEQIEEAKQNLPSDLDQILEEAEEMVKQ